MPAIIAGRVNLEPGNKRELGGYSSGADYQKVTVRRRSIYSGPGLLELGQTPASG